MCERWTRAVIHYRGAVIAAWVVIVIFGLFSGSRLSQHLTTSLVVPGSESAAAGAILSERFGESVEGTFTVVLPFNKATPIEIEKYKEKIAAAASVIPTGKIIHARALAGVLYANVGTSLNLIQASALTEKLREALANEGLNDALVTGAPAMEHDIAPVLSSDLRYGAILALLLALALLIIVLGLCWALVLPFLVAAASIAASVGAVFLLAQHFLMVLYIPNVIELIALGLAIDYSLIILHRFRGEIAVAGVGVNEALVKTMERAGRTVVLSGFVAAIGLATLFLVPVPFVRSLGAAALIVPIVSLSAAVTLAPALLSLLGRGGVTPVGVRGLMAKDGLHSGAWAHIARVVIRRPVTVLVSSLLPLLIAASSVLWLSLTPTSLEAMPPQLESVRALALITERAGAGAITPNEIVFDFGGANRADTASVSRARMKLAMAILKSPEVFVVATDTTIAFVDPTGRYGKMFVIGRSEFGDENSTKLVRELRNLYIPAAEFPIGTKIYLGGAPAQGVDFLSSVYGAFPWVVLLALVLAYFLLLRAFRSMVLPLVAVVLNLISMAATYGLLVVLFQFGFGSSILGIYQVNAIEGWVPIFLFAVLFGLSMDYTVFIVSRMRESRDRGSSNSEAITEGLAHTGGVVTAAAIILVGALGGLAFGNIAGLQQLGIGLALGILIDATIVRGLLLPSVMTLLGRWNWWLPQSVAKLVKSKASPLEIRGARL